MLLRIEGAHPIVVELFGVIGGEVGAVAVGSLSVVERHPLGGGQRQLSGAGESGLFVDEFFRVIGVH